MEGLLQTIQAASDRDTKTDQIPSGLAPSEATAGQLDQGKSQSPIQPTEGFGAPPSYEDLDSISVKCSDCGATMSMEELGIHDCTGTTVMTSLPEDRRRSVPLPPSARTKGEDNHSTVEETNTTMATKQRRAVPVPPMTRPLTSAQEAPEEAAPEIHATSDDLPAKVLGNTIEDVPILELHHEIPDDDLEADMQEIRLDDDIIGEDQIQMTVADDSDITHQTPIHLSKTTSEDSFQSANETEAH